MEFLKEIDNEVKRCENIMTKETEDSLMDRIQGMLWVRNLIYKRYTQPEHDVEKYYKDDYKGN